MADYSTALQCIHFLTASILRTEICKIKLKNKKLVKQVLWYAVIYDIVIAKFLQHERKSGGLPDFIAFKLHVVLPSRASFFIADLKI